MKESSTNSLLPIERGVMRAVALRIMPLLAVAYFAASLDRVNVGFAALQMNRAIGLDAGQFGFGASIFFIAYSLFAVPGALLIERIGVRRGIACVMLAWGLASSITAFVQGPISFYLVRFLLGATEAAFFPGVIQYLGGWLPLRFRGQLLSILMLGLPMASVLGSPLSAALLTADGHLGLRGWQWLFLIEAAPAILVGLLSFRMLPASINEARWLTPQQQQWLTVELARERVLTSPRPFSWQLLLHPRVLALSMINIGAIAVTNGLAIWQPQIIHSFGLSVMQTGILNALPFALGTLAMFVWAWHSDRAHERRLHTALPLVIGGIALGATFLHTNLAITLCLFCIAVSAASMIKSPFWALATECAPAGMQAATFGHITSLTNIGAFVGTYAIGKAVHITGSYAAGMAPLMVMMLAAFGCALIVGYNPVELRRSP